MFSSTIKAAIFDLDGTLIDSRTDLAAAINAMRGSFEQTSLDVKTITNCVGDGIKKLVSHSTADFQPDINEAVKRTKDAYMKNLIVETCLYDGVKEVLQRLKNAGIQAAVVTNKPEKPASIILETLGIREFFAMILGGDSTEQIKPDPLPLNIVMDHLNVSPRETIMIGDHRTDLAAGKAAGTRTCLCRYGFGTPADLPFDMEIQSPAELVRLLLDSDIFGHIQD